MAEDLLARLRRAEDELRSQVDAQARLAFLAAISLELDSSHEVDETFLRVSRMMVPAVADACLVYLRDDAGPRLVAAAHLDVAQERALRAHVPSCPTLAERVEVVLRSGEPIESGVECTCADGLPARYADGVLVPLRARGRVFGGLWLARDRLGADSRMLDVAFVDDLGRRVAIAVDNALLHRQRRDNVIALQRRLLPPTLPSTPEFEFAAAYEVADVSLDVGGDFYDVVRQPGGSFALIVGDVCGRGASAAGLNGLSRHTLRLLLEEGWSPADALARLNRSIRDEGNLAQFCTVLVISLTPETDGATATVTSAGHPLPYRISEGGTVTQCGANGQLLGVFPQLKVVDVPIRLGFGDTLFLYTDGVTEARSPAGLFEDRLVAELAATGGSSAAETVERVRTAVTAYRRSAADDVAILAARLRPPGTGSMLTRSEGVS
ncbi:PP2C family protein-serine/threonine phosphatase [Cryptosporangium arvum]|uniref:PP2C family protein-serine/threonine phosphatase n=1 Tax=Cryptosporangium arvum TaxID=80871 RepID=UPI0004B61EEB|nr:SpoIIE family protein phosphatase [Cryptosporangium arvum]